LPILTRDSVSKCGPVKMRINGVEPGAMLWERVDCAIYFGAGVIGCVSQMMEELNSS
jgi:hypothetical protein